MNKKIKQLLFFLVRIGVAAGVVVLLLIFVVAPRIVHGNRMYPSLRDGQFVLVSRLGRVLPDRVVLYRSENGEEQLARVVGTEEDLIEVKEDAGISVNGMLLPRSIPYPVPEGEEEYPYQVSKDSFFLVNDYREDVSDSRSFGEVSKKDIIGVVVFTMQYRDF